MSSVNNLPGSIVAATSGSIGFDCDVSLNAASVKAFVSDGFKFVVRYLSLGSTQHSNDLSVTEAAAILENGLALMAVQHVMLSEWSPTKTLGVSNGTNAANNALSIGLPNNVTVWLDLEGINSNSSAADVIEYCNSWFSAVTSAGYLPGLYVGANCILNSNELYYDLNVSRYWKSGSNTPTVAVRGFCVVQTINNSFVHDGISYDKDIIQTDNNGNTPNWLVLDMSQSLNS